MLLPFIDPLMFGFLCLIFALAQIKLFYLSEHNFIRLLQAALSLRRITASR